MVAEFTVKIQLNIPKRGYHRGGPDVLFLSSKVLNQAGSFYIDPTIDPARDC